MNEQIPQVPVDPTDLLVLNKYFKDNEEMLIAMRAIMMNLNPTEADKKLVSEAFADEELFKIISYRFLPEAKRETPIGQIQDMWLGAETMVFGASRDSIEQAVMYKDESISMTKLALALLKDPEGAKPLLAYSPQTHPISIDPLQVGLLGRNQFMRHIEQQLTFLKIVAAQPLPPTPAEAKKKKLKNSSH